MMQFPAAISERSKYPSAKPGAVGFEPLKGLLESLQSSFPFVRTLFGLPHQDAGAVPTKASSCGTC
jgi:hypothetical protein